MRIVHFIWDDEGTAKSKNCMGDNDSARNWGRSFKDRHIDDPLRE